ncbi:helix-turn-helix domain-containing protein [Aestuariivita boseongensis]|uniref:helix-turn-helix domain-containing protein n=1 Tax=Aestuariivita boseongensis TaxID=1470562 RepID=UPI00068235D2|nr:RodZ domain-containing protein [Aestuariivita boseongensis]
MIRRKSSRTDSDDIAKPKGFDDFELRLGDVMRGERATMGKSLLDVQRELRIKASYIAAIENCDPSAFDTPGFIAGYVRSYARYLNMNPDEAYQAFCRESGFEVAHGMSSEASVVKRGEDASARARRSPAPDPFGSTASPFNGVPGESILAQIEPRAIGSMMVLVALMGGLGYGGWTVLREVQQVQVAPVDQTPVVLSDLDPLNTTSPAAGAGEQQGFTAPSVEALDRLYRPQALDVPVLVARDAPIATLDPRLGGAFSAPETPRAPTLALNGAGEGDAPVSVPQVVETTAPQLRMVAVRPAWVRVTSADGTVVFEGIMEGGQTYDVPATEEPPSLRVGESGSIYFDLNGAIYGPVGNRGTVTSNFALAAENVSQTMALADLDVDSDLARMVAEAAIGDNARQ